MAHAWNGCSQSSRFPTAGQGERSSGNVIAHEFKLVWIRTTYRSDKISASNLVAPCVRICDKSLRQNLNKPMRKHQLVSRHVKFELVYISFLPKSITCNEQESYRSISAEERTCRRDVLQRFVASCVSALKNPGSIDFAFECIMNSKSYQYSTELIVFSIFFSRIERITRYNNKVCEKCLESVPYLVNRKFNSWFVVFVATAAVEFDNSHSEKRNCWLSRKKEPLTPHNTILNDTKVKMYSHVFISRSEVSKNCCKITVKLNA